MGTICSKDLDSGCDGIRTCGDISMARPLLMEHRGGIVGLDGTDGNNFLERLISYSCRRVDDIAR